MYRTIVLLVVALAVSAACFGADKATVDFWQKAVLQLKTVPPEPAWSSTSLSFQGPDFASCRVKANLSQGSSTTPVLYLLDRDKPDTFRAEGSHTWVALDCRELAKSAALGDPSRHPVYRIAMVAQRSLELLLGRASAQRAGIVGEGAGATAALALAAMSPTQCSFVAVYQPQTLPGQTFFDPSTLAGAVRAPTLVGLHPYSAAATSTTAIKVYMQLSGKKELTRLQLSRACWGATDELKAWQSMWQSWAGVALHGHDLADGGGGILKRGQ